MATEEHKRLADVVKETHALLRTEYHQYGAEVAWERHMARNDVLQYATSMQKLATKYWKENDSKNGTYCRMLWIRTQCKEYFLNGGKEKYDKRERDIYAKMTGKKLDESCTNNSDEDICMEDHLKNEPKISVLDVGSCYNPLSVDEAFDVTAIDLIPDSTGGIFRCDFLNVAIGEERILSRDAREIYQLAARSFDAVVFSLLLEYLPCPEQRYNCCRNAYDVLKIGGLLLIVSPDSKHVGANARLMKSWRYTLSRLGFMRIKYEKLRHIHCLAFRKCACKDVATRWCELQRFSQDDRKYISETEIFIPQDFQTICFEEERGEKSVEYNETDLASTFSELPFDNEM
ncbi:S-adenosylmethionine sensor upstream of mTORC1-like isoform X2 [Nylanderia fulva]|uniref:S-adenosylmethionine sensor upstream of mTORC1-like isoform X2 n=1 Tax=Nylanderia fulva TaxID=613905 RepID=UPI0010FB594A|nr:S-adenosylmethionine sensor upstream of mTORC1-like isoform X2 [Nylanderia fulva]